MTPNDYHVYVPVAERVTFLDELKDYRIWEEDASDDDTLALQGHPGMGDVLRDKFRYDFNECINGAARDLWIGHSFEDGEWRETYECDSHWNGDGYRSITLDEFNDLFEYINDQD